MLVVRECGLSKKGAISMPLVGDTDSHFFDRYFRNIIDIIPSYISIQNRELKILFVNQTFKKDLGNGTGRICHEVYKGSHNKCRSCPVIKTFNDKKIHLSEESFQTLDGEVSQVIIYSAPILDSSGNVDYVMEMSTNITRIKRFQKELTALGQSIAFMSHGIKNILEGLQGGVYVVDEGIHDGDMDIIKRGWNVVKNNIIDISAIAQNVLYSSKKRKLRLEKVSLRDILKDSTNLFQDKAAFMGIDIKYEVNIALPEVYLDAFSIRRMLNNLISNALEACAKDKGKKSHKVVIRADLYNEFQFKFEVEDNGPGMDKETRKKIFNDFFSTKGTKGTGLGLTVSNRIVKEHKGKIEVESTPGKGTLFRVILNM